MRACIAAAIPLAGLALHALTDAADVRSGDRILIHAAGGGVGHLPVQIAKPCVERQGMITPSP